MNLWILINPDILGNIIVALLDLKEFINVHSVCKNWQIACKYKPLTLIIVVIRS